MAAKTKRARIKLLKHVIIEGKHTDKGSKIEMDRHKATELVSAGQAEFLDEDEEDGREREEEQLGVRIERPTNGDPGVKNLDPRSSKRGGGGRGKPPAGDGEGDES